MSSDDDRQVQLDLLAEEFVERERSGDRPSVAEYAEAHPDLAGDIESIFPLLSAMESVKHDDGNGDELPAGAEIGDYKLLRVIGRGGMGIVYEAEQKTLGRRVALKVLPHLAQLDPRTVERFRVEAQAAAGLKHPRIVPVIGYGEHDGVHFYTMQYIDGRGLDEIIDEAREAGSVGPDHFRRAARVALQAADGIAHAHANGVLHRDVKPSNLLIDADGSVWITDFGLAKAEDSGDLTRTGDVLGTFRYMPPERFRGESDARGDVYGLGITLYELLTRRRAYEEEDRAALAAQIANTPPPRPRAHEPAIPLDLETIVRKAMAHDPAQRYATVVELAGDLRAFLDGRPIAARAPSFGYLLRSAITRHKPLALTMGLALLLLIGSTVWYVLDLREKERRARFREYAAIIAAVESAWATADKSRASELLARAPVEFRNWEWRYLQSRLDPSLRRFEDPLGFARCVAYHPDGQWFAATFDTHVVVYSDATGEAVHKLETAAPPVQIAWSPRGDRLAVSTLETVELWSWPETTRIAKLPAAQGVVTFARNGAEVVLATTTPEGTLLRIDADGKELSRTTLDSTVLSMAGGTVRGEDCIALTMNDGNVRVLRVRDGSVVWAREVSRVRLEFVLFIDRDRLAVTTEGLVRILSADDGRELRAMGTLGHAAQMIWDPRGRRLLVFGRGALLAFDPDSGERLRVLRAQATPSTGAIHPDGRRAVVNSADRGLREWFLGDRDPTQLGRHVTDIGSIAVHPGGRFAASCGFGGVVRLWDLETTELARVFFGHGFDARSRFSPDGSRLAIVSGGTVVIRDFPGGTVERRWTAHDDELWILLEYVPGGETERLVTYGTQDVMRLWDAASGRMIAEAQIGEQGEPALAVSRDGRWIATGDADGRIRLWDGSSLRLLRELRGHDQRVTGLAFHPHEDLLASAAYDRTLRLWDAASGEQQRVSRWGTNLSTVAFSPDGSRIATGSHAGVARIWDAQGLQLLAGLDQGAWTNELIFTPDGTRLLATISKGVVRISDSVPLRERVPAIEGAVALRKRALPIVEEMARTFEDPDELLAALEARTDLEPDLHESARRVAHHRRATNEAYIARMWRDITSEDGDPDRRRTALGLGRALWRALRHARQEDPRCETLLGIAFYRAGDADKAMWVFDRVAARHETRAPELHAVDLAFVALSRMALEQPEEAAAALARLEALLQAQPGLATPRVRGFLAEARKAVRGK